jgi:GT2 family glycosyltransferase
VVVTYNRLDKLRRTLARLLDTPAAVLDAVVVVDNASDDGTGAWLDGLDDPRLLVYHSQSNLGGAGGFETGMRLAMDQLNPDWIVVMDDDAYPLPGALAAFHALPAHQCEAVAAAVYFPDGAICGMNRPVHNPFRNWPLKFWRSFHLLPVDYAGPGLTVDAATFVGLFVSRAAIARVGYPDGRLFVYGDDTLFTLGLSQAGGMIGFAPSVRFEHDCSTLSDGRFTPLWKVYYYHRNLLLFYRLAGGWRFWPAFVLLLPKWLSKARFHAGDRRAYLRLLRRAVRDGVTGRVDVDHAEIIALSDPHRLAPAETGA